MREFRENNEAGVPEATFAGWVADVDAAGSELAIRDQEGFVTLALADGPPAGRLSSLAPESVVEVTGTVLDRDDDRYELGDASIDVYSEPQRQLPLDPATRPEGDFGSRLRHRHLDLRNPATQALFRIRAEVLRAIRARLRDRGAIEFETPILVPGVTDTRNTQLSVSYPGKDVQLAGHHSSQYNQLLVAGGFERVFAIQKSFGYHEESLVHAWGVVETTMLHIECAFVDHAEFLELVEDLIVHVHEQVAANCADELETLGVDFSVPDREFPRIPYEEFVELANEIGDEEYTWGEEVEWWTQRAVMDRIGEYHFVTGLPAGNRDANEVREADGHETVVGFDLNYPDFEVMFGSEREYRPERLERAVEADDHVDADQSRWYLDAFQDGVPPHTGGSLGIDRLLMGMLDLRDMREAIAFPRDRNIVV